MTEPGRRGGGGRTEDYGQLVRAQDVHGFVQPGEIVMAFRGFHEGPGKFGNADVGDAEIRHHAGVFFPKGFGGLIGIVVGAEEEWEGRCGLRGEGAGPGMRGGDERLCRPRF